MRRRTLTTIDVDGIEVELDNNPEYFEPITSQPTPTTLVVGYLLHDDDCMNPMTDWDGEGRLYTNPARMAYDSSITDDSSAPCKLGLNEFGSRGYDPEYDLELDGIEERVAEKLKALIKGDPKLTAWMVSKVMELNESADDVLGDLVQLLAYGTDYARRDWTEDEDQEQIDSLGDYETLAREAWEELYAEGKIGEYLAVPVYYAASVHGPGTTQMYPTSLDDANAVWVPGECEIGNMTFSGCVTYADKLAVAVKYAEGCLDTYEKWCNSECYGIVTESFVLSGDGESYEKVDDLHDSCWGYIGQEWAEEALKEQMGYVEKRFKEEKEAA